jgi:hypothetical protein
LNTGAASSEANDSWRIAAAIAVAAFVALALYLAPGLVTAFVRGLGFSASSPGYVIAAEMAGMGIATFPALWWLRRVRWGRLAAAMLVIIAVGDLLSMFMTTPITLGATRFVTGLAEGTVSIICMSALRLTRDPNRSFGFWLFAQLAVGALALLGLPALLATAGVAGFYGTLAVLALALASVAGRIASGHNQDIALARSAAPLAGSSWQGVAGLAAVVAFYTGFSAVWTFAGQMAAAGTDVAGALSVAPIGGMAGAAIAGAIGKRFGPARPLGIAAAILAGAVVVLGRRMQWLGYAAGCFAVLFGWTLAVPFLLGGIAKIDRSGRLTVAVNIAIGGGLAAGPALAAAIVGRSGRYQGVVGLTLGLTCVSYVLALPMLRANIRGELPS